MKSNGFKPSWIVWHHSSSTDGVQRDYNGIKKYHMSYRYKGVIITKEQYDEYAAHGKTIEDGLEKPWKNIGYHFVVERIAGKVEVIAGRPIGEVGAHCLGFNDKSIGICFVGCYDAVAPDSDMLFTGSSLTRQLSKEFDIPVDQCIGHWESYALRGVPVEKSCPGKLFDVDNMRARVKGIGVI